MTYNVLQKIGQGTQASFSGADPLILKVVKIQAAFRGYLLRKRIQETCEYDSSVDQDEFFRHPNVQAVYERCGPFSYVSDGDVAADTVIEEKRAFRLFGGVIYQG